MGSLPQDCRYALRQLRKSLGFTLTAVLTLAFGIGATTAIFSIVEGVLLRPLPFPNPSRLVFLGDIIEGVQHDETEAPSVTAPGAVTYMRDTRAFSGLGAYRTATYELSSSGNPVQINAARVTAGIFPTLGVAPVRGRAFTQQEEANGEQLAVLSFQTWVSRFNADPQIVQRKILLDRKPYRVIGVMPRDFEFPLVPGHLNRCELWVPMHFTKAELIEGVGNWGYYLAGRLKAGMTSAEAEQDAIPAAREIMRNFPPGLSNRHLRPAVRRLDQITIAHARPLIRTLFLAVIVVLFIACSNLAGLLLVRFLRRRREISVRMAVGASRVAVLRQPLIEATLVSVAGGALGLVLAGLAVHAGVSFLPETLPRLDSIRLDWGVVAVAFGIALLTGMLCGLAPGLAAARTDVSEALKDGGRTGSAGAGHARLRSGLVIAELAVALVLLAASGLLLRSFQKMRSANLGFEADHTLTASYSLPRQQYSTQAAVDTFNLRLRTRLEQLPGVHAVGITSLLPATGTQYLATFTPEGYIPKVRTRLNLAWMPEVMGDYFAAQGIPILRGRNFTAADRAGAALVIIVNRSLAEHYWPGQNPIGKRLHRGPAEAALPWLTIVGEIDGVKQLADEPAEQEIYIPSAQSKATAGSFATPNMITGTRGSIVLRAALPPERLADSVRRVVRSIDPELPLTDVAPMDQVVSEGQAPRRFNTALICAFAAAAVLLALLGTYSVMAFSTAMRTQEMAIRLALGSQRAALMRLVLGSAMKLGLAGSILGVAAALFTMRLLSSFLFEVQSLDPVILLLAAGFIFLLALAASAIPACRAASIEPVEALRAE
jgi:predicted permease